MTDSLTLLGEYIRTGSESAFRELVSRHINLVYSTALRVVGGDTHLAEDVAQTVFLDLARKARTLPSSVILGGWLHRHTCYLASKAVRAEVRRRARERQAAGIASAALAGASAWSMNYPMVNVSTPGSGSKRQMDFGKSRA